MIEIPRILDLHYKSLGTDGVSLMMQLFNRAFLKEEISSHFASFDAVKEMGDLKIEELDYQTSEMGLVRQIIFQGAVPPEQLINGYETLLQAEFEKNKLPISEKIKQYILDNKITHVIVRNIFSLPLNLPVTLALYDLTIDTDLEAAGVKFVLIHHDFYWEPSRSTNYETKYQYVLNLLGSYFPPVTQNPRVIQFVINSLMQKKILENFGLELGVLPDMEEFTEETVSVQEQEKTSLREKLDIKEDDFMIVMPTRVVPRKAIEFAIGFTKHLQKAENRLRLEEIGQEVGLGLSKRKFSANSKITLVIPQGEDLADSQKYADALSSYAMKNNVKLVFAGEHVRPDAAKAVEGDDRIPFSSVYGEADLVIYPTVAEGFGNQLLEIVKNKLLPIVFEYETFQHDIKQHLKHFISLGNVWEWSAEVESNETILRILPEEAYEKAIEDCFYYLRNPEKMKQAVEENYDSIRAQFDSSIVAKKFLQKIGAVA